MCRFEDIAVNAIEAIDSPRDQNLEHCSRPSKKALRIVFGLKALENPDAVGNPLEAS